VSHPAWRSLNQQPFGVIHVEAAANAIKASERNFEKCWKPRAS
jgi:hypothetical protein